MNRLAFVTAESSLPDDFDMPLLLDACLAAGLNVEVRSWHDPLVDWSSYESVILRSPWDYGDDRAAFLLWCERVSTGTTLLNPLSVVRWSTDKHYLLDLIRYDVPVVPSLFVEPGSPYHRDMIQFMCRHPEAASFVIKPSIGCYSKDVKRVPRDSYVSLSDHISYIVETGRSAILQPYLPSVDDCGETNLIYFDGTYSHAIRKQALLAEDGTVNVPTYDFRSACEADNDERAVAVAALDAVMRHLGLARPLLYARVDLIRDTDGAPRILEFDISEPSLSLPLAEAGAERFAQALRNRHANGKGTA